MVLILKIILASVCMTGIYFLLLSRQKSFRFNRGYLLLSLLLPLIVPFISIELNTPQADTLFEAYIQTLTVWQNGISTNTVGSMAPVEKSVLYSTTDFILLGFLLISSILFIRYLLRVYRLLQLKKSAILVQSGKVSLALSEEVVQPFSFLSIIYLNKASFECHQVPREILLHETAHCEQHHSLDILCGELLLVFTWWNPANWLLLRLIRENHEFLADEKVVSSQPDETVSYLQLLLTSVSSKLYSPVVSEFNYSFIKKRFTMIQKKHSRNSLFYSLTSILLCGVMLAGFMSFRYRAVMQLPVKEEPKDTVPKLVPDNGFENYLAKRTYAYSDKGISAEEMQQYKSITDKYDSKRQGRWVEISIEDQARLKELFGRMSKEQQRGQRIRFLKRLPPFSKNVPTETQFTNFKKAAVYGVWVDDKKVSNEVLNQYTSSDFAHYSVSKLYGAAKKGRNYTHQVNLMTKKAYEEYLRNERKNANEPIMVMSWQPHVGVVEKAK